MNDDIQSSLKTHNARTERAQEVGGGTRRSAIEIPVLHVGEVIQQVWFPHYYIEKPLHYWGVEIVGNFGIATGRTPLASAMIRSWNKDVTPEGVTLYKGARIACVVAGNTNLPEEIQFTFKVTFEGRSIVVPVSQ